MAVAHAHAQGRRVQLQVEQLEDRLVPSRFGPEILVDSNPESESFQGVARVAVAPNGHFVVAWTSNDVDSEDSEVFARRYNAKGKPQGDEFRVNTTPGISRSATNTSIAMDASGNFMVCWDHYTGSSFEVRAQRFDPLGNALGGELTLLPNASAKIAMKANGDFALGWSDGFGFGVQFFDAQGQPQGAASLVPGTVDLRHGFSNLAMDAQGNCLVLWSAYQGQTVSYFVRQFDDAGQYVRDIDVRGGIQANATGHSTLAVRPNGAFLVVWQRNNASRHMKNLWGRLYHASGEPRGPAFQINKLPSRHQSMLPDAIFAKDGSFAVAWMRMRSWIGFQEVIVRRFDAQGRPLTGELHPGRLNSTYLTVAAQPGGTFVLAWTYGKTTSLYGLPTDIYARRYDPSAPPANAASPLASNAAANQPSASLDRDPGKSSMDSTHDWTAIWQRELTW